MTSLLVVATAWRITWTSQLSWDSWRKRCNIAATDSHSHSYYYNDNRHVPYERDVGNIVLFYLQISGISSGSVHLLKLNQFLTWLFRRTTFPTSLVIRYVFVIIVIVTVTVRTRICCRDFIFISPGVSVQLFGPRDVHWLQHARKSLYKSV